MTTWQELTKEGKLPEWPYPIRYEQEQEIDTDILVLGGGIAGCWAAISAARKGVRVTLVEKGDTIRSGAAGPGCDNWCDVPLHPLIKFDPDDWAKRRAEASGGYSNGIARQIQMREDYDALLEMENMGGKIRDYDGDYKDCMGYDDKTKFVIYMGYSPLYEVMVWGNTFKPLLKKECQRLGVKIFDRVMATSLLTEDGIQGNRVVGATGVNNRTGEFMVFNSKATILCMAGVGGVWVFQTELAGITTFRSRANSGDGAAMAWNAGAELTCMEKSGLLRLGTGFKHKWYCGAADASYRNVPIVDADGKPVTGNMRQSEQFRDAVLKGEYALPFYGDFPSMPESERRITWGMMVGEESTTRALVRMYNEAGFDPGKDQLQCYNLIEGASQLQWRSVDSGGDRGGVVIDWDLKTTLDGLYAAGESIFCPGDHSFAAATGRYAGRKAVEYIKQIGKMELNREQVAKEKARVFAPIKRTDGIEWKELHAGIARKMQFFCSEYRTEKLFKTGLDELYDIEENFVPRLYALDPHKLMRSLEDISILTYAKMIMYASMARKASSEFLKFERMDYPEVDPPEWRKFITIKQEDGKVKIGELPLGYWGNLKDNYEAHNKDYTGVYER